MAKPEGSRVEFKLDLTPPVVQDFTRDLSAFANAEGGHIIFGVNNKRKIVGVNWDGVKSSQVVQEGQNCVPPVLVAIHEIPYPRVGTVVAVEVPKGSWIHMDTNKRFPIRTGDHTGFMDALSLVAKARERGMIPNEPNSLYSVVAPYIPHSRKKPSKLRFLADDLFSKDASVRAQALMDLGANSYQYNVESLPNVLSRLVELLDDESSQVRQQTLQVLATVVPRLPPARKKEMLPKVTQRIGDLAIRSKEMPVRTLAVTVLCIVDASNVIPVILELVKNEPEATFQQLGLQNGFMHLRGHETAYKLRERLSKELSGTEAPEIRSKIVSLIDGMRGVGWAV